MLAVSSSEVTKLEQGLKFNGREMNLVILMKGFDYF